MTKTRKKKTDRQKLIVQLDKAFGTFIKLRDKNICFTCGKNKTMMELHRMVPQPGHLFSRVSYSTRWDELNTHCQCSGCNMAHEFRAEVYTLAFLKKYGVESYERLNYKNKSVAKFHDSDLVVLIDHYNKEAQKLSDAQA